MRRIGVWLCCGWCAALGLASLPGMAQSTKAGKPAKAEHFTEATEVLVVEVPVQVLRNGEPVRGLTAGDFELWEGREKQTITGFEVLDLAAAGPAVQGERKTVVPPSARRRFLLLFDLSSSDPLSIGKAREAARSLVSDGLHPTDLVGVAMFEAARGAELILGFTGDRRQLEVALARLGEKQTAADPLRLVMTSSDMEFAREAAAAVDGGDGGGGGGGARRAGGDEADQAGASGGPGWADIMRMQAEGVAQAAQRNSMTDFSESVTELARTLAAIEGRKHVVFLSEGFDSGYLFGTQDQAELDRMSEASQGGEYWRIDSNTRYGSTKMIAQVEGMLEELRRADCVIQAVDIAGLRAPGEVGSRAGSALRQDGLFVLADSTGGELYSNFNDLSEAMDSMLKRHSVTYVLSYQPEQVRHDGSFRKLRVELKQKTGRGAQIVHRPGYYAPRPFAEQAAIEKTLDTASQVIGGREGGSIPVHVLAAPFARTAGKSYVPVLIEAEGTGLLSGQKDEGVLPAEVYVYAFDADGQVQDFFARSLGLDLGKVGPALRHRGLKMFGDLDLPAGSYSLRVLVRNGATGATSLKVASLEVPAFSAAAPVLLPPFFPEPADRWLLVRENAAPPVDVAYPFMDRQNPFIPAAHPDLRPGEEARLSLVGWHLKPGELRADALILTADGNEAGTGEIRLLDRQTDGAGADRIAAGFRPPRLAPGDYHLLVTLTDPTGAIQTSTAEFTISAGAGGLASHSQR